MLKWNLVLMTFRNSSETFDIFSCVL